MQLNCGTQQFIVTSTIVHRNWYDIIFLSYDNYRTIDNTIAHYDNYRSTLYGTVLLRPHAQVSYYKRR